MESVVKLYSLSYANVKTYGAALLFVAGNIALPQLFHLVPQGGMTWLPIYFFTLVGAYKYGWKVGLLTAIISPLINSALFGMPAPAVLPAILLKSVLLAVGAGWMAHRFQKVSVLALLAGVLFYQCIGTLGEWAFFADRFYADVQVFGRGIPRLLFPAFRWSECCRHLTPN